MAAKALQTDATGRPAVGTAASPRRLLAMAVVLFLAWPLAAQMGKGPIGVPAQKLGAQVPLNLAFRDEFDRPVTLGSFFNQGKPVILTLVYYECPMLCSEVLNGLSSSMRMLPFELGKQYDVVTVSFNPKDTTEVGRAKKRGYLQRYGHPEAANGWHFLVGEEANIHALTEAVGFHYQWDPQYQQYAHPAVIMVLTTDGRIAQYYYGVDYPPRDLRLGLVQASHDRIGTVVDQVLLYCYHYDPRTGRYGAVIGNVLKAAGAATVLILGSVLVFFFRHEPRKRTGQV